MLEKTLVISIVIFIGFAALAWLLISSSLRGLQVYQQNFTATADSKLSRMFLFIDGRKVFLLNLLALLVIPVGIYFLLKNWLFVIAALVLALVMPKIIFSIIEKRRLADFQDGLPDALAQIAGSMRAGTPLPAAIEHMTRETKGPISQEFSLMLREHRLGVSMDEALENLGARMPCEEIDLVTAAALIARDVGGNLAETFERLASSLRAKAAVEGKIRALTSQGKLQGWVVGFLPVAMILILFKMEPAAMGYMLNSLFGWIVIAIIVVLELMGMFMIRKIVSIDV